jgi:hypothetical protein
MHSTPLLPICSQAQNMRDSTLSVKLLRGIRDVVEFVYFRQAAECHGRLSSLFVTLVADSLCGREPRQSLTGHAFGTGCEVDHVPDNQRRRIVVAAVCH